jgi:hypothetical protein
MWKSGGRFSVAGRPDTKEVRMITAEQRAGHALRVKVAKLAEATVAELYRVRPDLPARYGPDGRRHCVRDVGHHVVALAASVELADPRRFARYVGWARSVMAAHGVPPADLFASLRALRRAAEGLLPPPAADLACRHLDAGTAACRT